MTRTTARAFIATALGFFAFAGGVLAQSTAFNYQGKLNESGVPASGTYQMQFRLFDSVNGAGQIGAVITDVPVTAAAGVFTARLDFGSNVFSGAERWLEIAIRHNSGEGYTTLSPREQIAASPYSVRTLSAASADVALDAQKLGGVKADQFVQMTDVRLADARNPLPGSGYYIQNTTVQQAKTNLNISGNGSFGGNVGIGTEKPAARLDVNGGLIVSSNGVFGAGLSVNANGAFISGASLVDGSLQVIGATTVEGPVSIGGHLVSTGSSTPTLSGCGNATVTGNDTRGLITTGTATGTACTLMFAAAYSSPPQCFAVVQTTFLGALSVGAASNSAVTIGWTMQGSGRGIHYFCIG